MTQRAARWDKDRRRPDKSTFGQLPGDHSSRVFLCQSCGTEDRGTQVPHGWYSISRHPGEQGAKLQRLGLYCCLACVVKQMPRMMKVEQALGADWFRKTAKFRQKPR